MDGGGGEPWAADLAIAGGRIVALGLVDPLPGDVELDCAGRLLMPGFVDAHSHADGVLFEENVQLALLRQGVTSVVGGQDGVSYAPGDGAYASEYFAAINGPHPSYRGGGVARLLASYDGATRLNFAYLVPAGTVRHEVMGRGEGRASERQLAAMVELVARGLAEGAVGLSSGLDYVPGIFADTAELAALCAPVARARALYVSHMRGGYESNSAEGIDEIAAICSASGVRAHVSHFHAPLEVLTGQLDAMRQRGVELSFDAYPYTRGCTLLGMPLLPPHISNLPVDEIVALLADGAARDRLRESWFPLVAQKPSLGPEWPSMITLAHIAAPDYAWAHGLTLAEASARAGIDAIDFSLDVLLASRLEVNAVMAVRHERPVSELGRILALPGQIGGSDGIFIGAHPHPRAYGTFARYLREYLHEHGFYSWGSAAVHLSARPAALFGLAERGRLMVGAAADVIVVDPQTVADRASYENPTAVAVGIDDVFVAGEQVLRRGQLTASTPGRGLRRLAT